MAEKKEKEAEEAKKLEPKVTREEVGPCKLKLTVEVSAAKVQERVDDRYKELNENLALPGFRKGHAPRKLLERKFGKSVRDDLKISLLNDSFEEAKEEGKIEPVGEPDLDVDALSVSEGEPFKYDVTLEVMPEIEVKDYKSIEIQKASIEVTDEEIDKTIEATREQRAEWVPAKDGKATLGDQIIGDFTLTHEEKQVDASENVQIELTPNIMLYQKKLEGFHKELEGKKKGATVSTKVTMPEDHANKEVAGKECALTVKIKSIKRKRLPPVDAKFFKSLDVDDEAELRDFMRKQVRRAKESDATTQMKDQIMDKIIEANSFVVPDGLAAEAEKQMADRLRSNYMLHGVPKEKLEKELEDQGTKVRDLGIKALRGQMILEAIANKERIFVTEGMLEERIGQMSQQYEMRPDEMRAYLEQQNLLASMRREYRAELTREFLLEQAKIAEPATKKS